MLSPRIPADEAERVAALRTLDILDTANESAFDGLVKLAAKLVGVETALVSLVDADRQWFKARVGMAACETGRDVSFCGHVVEQGERLVIPDAAADARFADNPLVVGGPRIRFYAGTPLRVTGGYVLGTLCVIDRAPRTPSAEQLESLDVLATQVVELLESRRQRALLVLEQRRAARAGQDLELLFEAMEEGVVVHTDSGVIVRSNAAASEILGLTPDQLHGRTPFDPAWNCVREDGAAFPGEEHPAMVALRTGVPQRNALGGELSMTSMPGVGTTFRILLPVATEPVSPPEPRAPAIAGPRAYVLAVDDEPAILSILQRALGKDHTVVAVTDGREALRLVQEGEPFDVVFCDLMMPHLRGDVLYREAARVRPALADRFVFITGGATVPELEGFLDSVPNERIEKPFNLQNLRGMVRRFALAEREDTARG